MEKTPASEPVWWTSLTSEELFSFARDRQKLRLHCFKSQTYFDARAALGGDPVLLEELAGHAFRLFLIDLESEDSSKRNE